MSDTAVTDGDLQIRRYAPNDFEAVVGLWERCGLRVAYNDPARDVALWRTSANAEIFLGVVAGRVVASVCVGHDGHRGNPYYVAVDPDARGRGYGRRMMRHAEAWLTRLGIPKMNVMIRETNRQVRDFYAAIGYEETPRLVMARWLTPDAAPPVAAGPEAVLLRCTVTSLEMTARPKHPPRPAPHGLHTALLRAVRPTVAFYRFLYDTVGAPWLWYERREIDDESLAAVVQDDDVEIYVLYVEGVPAGYAELDRRQMPDIELAYFGLMPQFIGRGLGRYLLSAAIDIAWGYEPKRLWVHTNTLDHPGALQLYQRAGFRPYRREEKLVPDPRLTGVIPAAEMP
jgi:ribosomal protein S18 acetylase RimI-like enzyme